MSTSTRGFALVVAAALTWGTSGVAGDAVVRRSGLDPLDVAWHRMAIGAVVLVGIHLARRQPLTTGGATGKLVVVGVGLAVYQSAYFLAVGTAGVSIATLVALGAAPLLIALGGTLLGHGRPDRATWIALVVALTGLVLLVGVSAAGETGDAVLLGALTALGCAVAYAAVVLTSSRVPAGVPTTTVGFAVGALALTPVALLAGLDLTADPVALALLVYLGVVPTALAYGLFFTGVRSVPAAVVSIVTLLEPLTATALAAVLLGERLAAPALGGGLLMLGAVAALYLRRLAGAPSGAPTPARSSSTPRPGGR